MAGAAAALATVKALSELAVPANIRLYLACAENAPGGNSYRPSDVVRHRSGRSTEVVSTDAEGRLVLADAIGYALERSPDEIVTVSTLTGGTGLGPGLWGVLGTSATIVSNLLEAGVRVGDPGWQLPLWDDYAPMLRSPVADARNYDFGWPQSAIAGAPPAILGGMFLHPFVGHVPWAHIDMAAAAWQVEADSLSVAGATGRPTRALVEYFMAHAADQ
jgi:leucyl aminopeptidase